MPQPVGVRDGHSPVYETRCLTLAEMLTDAWVYYRAARDNGDVAGEALWLEAFDCLLDRPDMPRKP